MFGTAPNKFLSSQGGLFGPGMRVLSVADGEGRNAVWLAEQGCEVRATEISPVAQEKCAKLARARHVAVDLVQADILNWTWPQAVYDAVVAIFIQFATPEERTRLFDGMKAAVKPGACCCSRATRRNSWNTEPAGRQPWKTSIPPGCCERCSPIGRSFCCANTKT